MAAETTRAALEEERARILTLFERTRACTERLAARLTPEDQQLQSMPDASPTKWHRAHTTWFFEEFALAPAGLPAMDSRYAFLFNSYYDAVGPRHARAKRGLLSRPSVAEIGEYRRVIDERVTHLLAAADARALARVLPVVELGVAHEEQHQELLLTDILHAFSENPLLPAFLPDAPDVAGPARPPPHAVEMRFVPFEGGVHAIGAPDDGGFAFDNERPRHKEWLEPFALADRLVTVRELKAFLDAGAYRTPSLWLAEGFAFISAQSLRAPLYYEYEAGALKVFTLAGVRVPADDEPAVHLSYYEADALARFLGARLPTEAEWEAVASKQRVGGNFLEDGALRSRSISAGGGPNDVQQIFGDAWEWTRSSYAPYPRYAPTRGALGEYNGKFMINQQVLRGGSCLTPRRHVRASYRNFWPAATRFQMTGVRLARDGASTQGPRSTPEGSA
jgi:ergothioneine biosynthesis protein EgtB